MRNYLKFGAFAATGLLLASCSSEEPMAVNATDGVINYNVMSDNQTRAAQSYCANYMPEEFKVYAYLNGTTPYIDGDRIVKSGDSWSDADGIRYWPDGDGVSMNFYAVINDKGKYASSAAGGSITDWSVLPDVEQQLDLMYAGVQNVASGATVGLNFRHALSQVCFKAKNENPNIQITVNSITVGNVAGAGTFALPTNADTSDNVANHEGTVSSEAVTVDNNWTSSETLKSFVVDKLGVETDGAYSGVTLASVDEDGNGVVTNISAVKDTESEQWFEKALMMIPQSADASLPAVDSDPTTGAFFKLNLTLDNVLHDGTTVPVTTQDFYVPVELEWNEGNRYVYTFRFPSDWTPDNMTPIEYDVNVDDFQANAEIEQPKIEDNSISEYNVKGKIMSCEELKESAINEGANFDIDAYYEILNNNIISINNKTFNVEIKDDNTFEINVIEKLNDLSYAFVAEHENDVRITYILKEIEISNLNTNNVKSMCYMFAANVFLQDLDLTSLRTQNVENMEGMFLTCLSLKIINLSSFDTSNVTNMREMFAQCESLTDLDLSNFDTSNVTNMSGMFSECNSLTDIRCKSSFRDWCIANAETIELPEAFRDANYDGWEIVD